MKNNDKTSFYRELEGRMTKEEIDKIYQKMSKEIFTQKILLATDAIEGAIGAIKEISKQYNIYIITARTSQLILDVEKWLEKNNIKQDITEILSSSYEEKQDICCRNDIHFLCDDDKRHLEKEKIENRILFNTSKGSNYAQIQQVDSWKEIKKMLLKIR